MQGEEQTTSKAIRAQDVESSDLDEPHKKMLAFVKLVTQHAYKTTDEDVQGLRDAGWSEEQIAEMVYITALFALFNRVADAFGLQDPRYDEMPAEENPFL